MALLPARTRALDSAQVAVWDLPADPAVVSTARQYATERLTGWGPDEAAFVTELVAGEPVTNVIRYGGAPIQLRLIRDRTLISNCFDAVTGSDSTDSLGRPSRPASDGTSAPGHPVVTRKGNAPRVPSCLALFPSDP